MILKIYKLSDMNSQSIKQEMDFVLRKADSIKLHVIAIYGIGSQYYENVREDSDVDYLAVTEGKANFGLSGNVCMRKIDILFIGIDILLDFMSNTGSNFIDLSLINCLGVLHSGSLLYEVSKKGHELKNTANRFIKSPIFGNILEAMKWRVKVNIKKAQHLLATDEEEAALFCIQYAFWEALCIFLSKNLFFFKGPYQTWKIAQKNQIVEDVFKEYCKSMSDGRSLISLLNYMIDS